MAADDDDEECDAAFVMDSLARILTTKVRDTEPAIDYDDDDEKSSEVTTSTRCVPAIEAGAAARAAPCCA